MGLADCVYRLPFSRAEVCSNGGREISAVASLIYVSRLGVDRDPHSIVMRVMRSSHAEYVSVWYLKRVLVWHCRLGEVST